VLPGPGHVIGELHAQKVVHLRAECFFDAQSHVGRQCGVAVEKIGERGAAHLQNLRGLGHAEAERFDDLGLNQAAWMGRVLHGHSPQW